jgi:hypothetical protein
MYFYVKSGHNSIIDQLFEWQFDLYHPLINMYTHSKFKWNLHKQFQDYSPDTIVWLFSSKKGHYSVICKWIATAFYTHHYIMIYTLISSFHEIRSSNSEILFRTDNAKTISVHLWRWIITKRKEKLFLKFFIYYYILQQNSTARMLSEQTIIITY